MDHNQIILACSDKGVFKGEYISKEAGHKGRGKRHLAIAVLLYNQRGQVLLQKRKHKIFDNIWDLTGATHPLHKEDGTDETLEQATLRCLKVEYDIDNISLKNLGAFNYFAPYHTAQGDFCENEHCFLIVGEYDGEVKLDPQVGYEYKWMDRQEFLKDIQVSPENYTPWAKEGVKIFTSHTLP